MGSIPASRTKIRMIVDRKKYKQKKTQAAYATWVFFHCIATGSVPFAGPVKRCHQHQAPAMACRRQTAMRDRAQETVTAGDLDDNVATWLRSFPVECRQPAYQRV